MSICGTTTSSCVGKPSYLQIAEGGRDFSGLNSCVFSMGGIFSLLFVNELCKTNQAVS